MRSTRLAPSRRSEALRDNAAHCSYYMRVGARSVGRPVQVCQPHVVLNLISPVDRHCLKPLCGPGWSGGLTRPVIVERLIVEIHHDRDRLGGDYTGFDANTDHIEDCETACKDDTKCA